MSSNTYVCIAPLSNLYPNKSIVNKMFSFVSISLPVTFYTSLLRGKEQTLTLKLKKGKAGANRKRLTLGIPPPPLLHPDLSFYT